MTSSVSMPCGHAQRVGLDYGVDDVDGAAPSGEHPAEDRPVEAVDDRGEVAPAVLAAPHAGQVGLPQLVRCGDVERAALGLRMARHLPCAGSPTPAGASRCACGSPANPALRSRDVSFR